VAADSQRPVALGRKEDKEEEEEEEEEEEIPRAHLPTSSDRHGPNGKNIF